MKVTEMAVGDQRLRISVTDRDNIVVSIGGKSNTIPISKITGPASRYRRSAKARTVSASRSQLDKLSTGQNGPTLSLRFRDLNLNEQKVFMVFDPESSDRRYTIRELAELAFPDLQTETAYYYTKNQLRRLMRARLLSKPSPGVYRLSEYGAEERSSASH